MEEAYLDKKEIYLDNSATTKVYKEAAEAAFEVMTKFYGNPSSLHSKGVEAEKILEEARKYMSSDNYVKIILY